MNTLEVFTLGALGLISACASDLSTTGSREGINSPHGDGDDDDDSPDVAAPGEFTASIEASADSVCPGTCVDLTARVEHGEPPYDFAWSPALPNREGPHRLCPSETTKVRVKVSHAADPSSEFDVSDVASASLTIRVRTDCEPPAPPPQACSVSIPVSAPKEGGPPFFFGASDVDAAGNLYFAAELRGSAVFGPAHLLTSDSEYPGGAGRIVLAKYDAACALQWVRWVGGKDRPLNFNGMDVNAEGDTALLFNAYGTPSGVSSSDLTLTSIATDGETRWTLESPAGNALWSTNGLHSVHWGRDGSLAVVGLASLCRVRDPSVSGMCVARLTAQGSPIIARFISGADGAAVDVDDDGSLVASGLVGTAGVQLSDVPLRAGKAAYAAKFRPDGSTAWLATTPLSEPSTFNWTQGYVHLNPEGELLSAWTQLVEDAPQVTFNVHAWRLAPDGQQKSLHVLDGAVGYGASELPLNALEDGTLVHAAHLNDGPARTEIKYWKADGSLEQTLTQPEAHPGSAISLRVSTLNQPIVTTLEGEGAQTGIRIQKF